MDLVRRHYIFSMMQVNVIKFVDICVIFQSAKGKTKNIRLYQPFPIASRPWERIRMDFIIGFPRTQKVFIVIFYVVHKFNKMAHLFP